MKKLLLALMIIVVALPAFAAPPELTRSVPANGETDVSLDIGVIRFYFDQNMKLNKWTFWMSDKGEFPPMDGPNDAPWRDPRTCEFQIDSLEPNTTYSVQLNSKLRQGFRSAKLNEALSVTVLVFTTGSGKVSESKIEETAASETAEKTTLEKQETSPPPATAEKNDDAPAQGLGAVLNDTVEKTDTKVSVADELILETAREILTAYRKKDMDTLAKNGTADTMKIFIEIDVQGEAHPRYKSIFSGHRWEAVSTWNGKLGEIEQTTESETRVTFNEFKKSKELAQLVLVLEEGKWRFEDITLAQMSKEPPQEEQTPEKIESQKVVQKEAKPEDKTSPEVVEEKKSYFAGMWVYEEPGMKLLVKFKDKNRYSRTTTTDQKVEKADGRFSVEEDELVLREDGGDVLRFTFRIVDDKTFEVKDEGYWYSIRKQKVKGFGSQL